MVDGRVNLLKSPEINKSDGGNLRRFSMGKANSLSIDEQSSSGERRSSTGSCHDFCKYGHKHSLETKARVPLLKRALKKSLDGKNSDLVVVHEKEKHSVRASNLKASPSSESTGGTDVVSRVVPIKSPSRRSPVETEKSLDRQNSDQAAVVLKKEQSVRATKLKTSPSSGTCITGGTDVVNRVVPINSPSRQSPVETKKSLDRQNSDQVVAMPEKEQSARATKLNASPSSGTCITGDTDLVNRVVPINSPSRRSPIETEKSLDGHNLDQIVPVPVPEKEKLSIRATKLKASPSSGTCINGATDVVNRVVPINHPSRRSPVKTEVMSANKERVLHVKSPSTRSPVKIEGTSESKELVVPVNSPSRQSPVETQIMTESSERVLLVNSPSRQSPIKIEVTSESKELVVPVNSSSRQSPVEIEIISESKELVVPESSPSRQSPYRRSPLKSEVMNESKELVAKTKTMSKIQDSKIHKTTKSESFPKQALTNIGEAGDNSLSKLKALKAKSVTSSSSSGNIAVHRNNSSKSCEGAATSKGNEMNVVGNSMVTSDPNSVDVVGNLPAIKNKNSKVVARVISQNKTRRAQTKEVPSVESEEKTKLVESAQNEKHSLKGYPKSPPSPYASSLANAPPLSPHKENRLGTKYTRSEANATFSGPKKPSGIKKEDDQNNVAKKGRSPRMLQTKGKDSSSLNLSFRSRKVVDIHSETHGPTRLKFIRGKSLGDNQKSKDSHRTSLKKGIVKVISKNSTPPSEKIVLRHQDVQDVQGKKDGQVSSNNVIAETARKLVRLRKSKVKALVGAFEKVISLQYKKPSVRATA